MVQRTDDGVWIQESADDAPSGRHLVSSSDPDLILDPTDEDLDLAAAFERGEIGVFESFASVGCEPIELRDAGRTRQPSLLTKHDDRVDLRGSTCRHVRRKQRQQAKPRDDAHIRDDVMRLDVE